MNLQSKQTARSYAQIEKGTLMKNQVLRSVTYFFLGLWALIVLFPFYWMVLTSVKSYGAYNSE